MGISEQNIGHITLHNASHNTSNDMPHKPLPIGVENFEEMIKKNYYYVDKSLFIKELIDKKGKVNLFTRPRRFGKTLLLSMLKSYFDTEGDAKSFTGLKIMDAGEWYTSHMNRYRVISLTLKSAKQMKLEDSMKMLRTEIAGQFSRFSYIAESGKLSDTDIEKYKKICSEKADYSEYKNSLKFLCECIYKATGTKVIILLDEYDVPLENAYYNGCYNEMIDFIRSLFESAFKTNDYLEFAVITGCLRISKESIFTGLNNLKINSILSDNYGEFFGFTDDEVESILSYYHLESKYDEVKEWYNGYTFGSVNVYNPWSSILYVDDHVANINRLPISYWANTSSNSIVKDLIERADDMAKNEIEKLIAGGTIEKPVHEDITYGEIYESQDNLWNFLFFTGYLKKVSEWFDDSNDRIMIKMCIPNREVRYIYREKILTWFEKKVKASDRTELFRGLLCFDAKTFENEIGKLLRQSISFNDYYENFYHGFLVGILTGLEGCIVKSNREGGIGRSDIYLKPLDMTKPGIVIEIKVADSMHNIGEKAQEALNQIIDKRYEEELLDEGYLETRRIGVAFFKKNCRVAV